MARRRIGALALASAAILVGAAAMPGAGHPLPAPPTDASVALPPTGAIPPQLSESVIPGPAIGPDETTDPPVASRLDPDTRISENESAAIRVIRAVRERQKAFKANALADEDGDGIGEYGSLGELSGLAGVRGGAGSRMLELPAWKVDSVGRMTLHGYHVVVFLPRIGGGALHDVAGGGMGPLEIDPDAAEERWAAYTWPVEYGRTGRRTFAVVECDYLETVNSAYSGPRGPRPDAAFVPVQGSGGSILGAPATDEPGAAGDKWDSLAVLVWRQMS